MYKPIDIALLEYHVIFYIFMNIVARMRSHLYYLSMRYGSVSEPSAKASQHHSTAWTISRDPADNWDMKSPGPRNQSTFFDSLTGVHYLGGLLIKFGACAVTMSCLEFERHTELDHPGASAFEMSLLFYFSFKISTPGWCILFSFRKTFWPCPPIWGSQPSICSCDKLATSLSLSLPN